MKTGTVLITGCSSGIGRAMAEEYHQRGFTVVATTRNPESLKALEEKGMLCYALDVRVTASIDRVIAEVLKKTKSIDILINNAGYGLMGPAIEIPIEEYEQQFQTNLIAPMLMAQKVAPVMKTQKSGRIINMGSISGLVTSPFSGAYCASKSALHALSDALRLELARFGIRVITVQPGAIESRFGDNAEAHTERILKEDSWYGEMEDTIRMRAQLSQVGASPVDAFAKKVVKKTLKKNPPAIIRTGKRSTSLPLMKQLLPGTIMDGVLRKKFGLG